MGYYYYYYITTCYMITDLKMRSLYVQTCSCFSYLVRELQQDIWELNQADLSEVDPEENSVEFMGILIKVHTSVL